MAMNLGAFASRVVATAVVATDGTGDFTDIQAAIDSLPAGGGVVYVKEGTYSSAASITISISNVALIGAGRATHIIITTDNIVISASNVDGIFLSNFEVVGDKTFTTNNQGIKLLNSNDSKILDCWVKEMGISGIFLDTCERGIISRNHITDTKIDGIAIGDCRHCIVNGNISNGCDFSGFIVDQQTADASQYNILSNNTSINNGADGFLINNGTACNLTDNVATGCSGFGININVNASNTLYTGNTLLANNAAIQDNSTSSEVGHNITS